MKAALLIMLVFRERAFHCDYSLVYATVLKIAKSLCVPDIMPVENVLPTFVHVVVSMLQ